MNCTIQKLKTALVYLGFSTGGQLYYYYFLFSSVIHQNIYTCITKFVDKIKVITAMNYLFCPIKQLLFNRLRSFV